MPTECGNRFLRPSFSDIWQAPQARSRLSSPHGRGHPEAIQKAGAQHRHAGLCQRAHLVAHPVQAGIRRQNAGTGFSAQASVIFGKRRRLEAAYHHPMVGAILKRFKKLGLNTDTLDCVSERIWWLTRFKRVFGDEGMPYMSADELFSVNPTISKTVMVEQAETPEDYFVKAGWILMACSGQTYGLNGSVSLLDKRHEQYFFSHDIVR